MPEAAPPAASSEAGLEIPQEELQTFCDFFYRKTGIRLDPKRRYFIERRIGDRMGINGCTTFRDYFSLLKFQAAGSELQALINEMTVNETYFFREEYQFDCLARRLLDEVATRKRKGDRIRIWSVPCSTGEEPYSIAYVVRNPGHAGAA